LEEKPVNIASLGIGNWSSGVKSTKSKIELIRDICSITGSKSLDIAALTIKDIKSILKSIKAGNTITDSILPQARTKAPYLDILKPMFPSVTLTKLSVSSLKELIQAVTYETQN